MKAARIPTQPHEPVAQADDERRAILDLNRILEQIPDDEAAIQIRIQSTERAEETIPISRAHFRMLAHIVGELARGHGLSLTPMEAELTTTEAARELKVSRPFLIGLLEKGEIPHRMVGSHRRVRFRDLCDYKQRTVRVRLEALEELSALDQEYGLG